MGNSETSQLKKADIIDVDLTHVKFANSKLVKADNLVNVQTIIGCQQKDYEKLKHILQSVKQTPEHLFLPVGWSFSSKNICGSSGHVTLNFPYFPYLLSEEIYNRLGKKTRFQQTDLWYLLYSLSAAKEEIRKYGLNNVGDVRTGNVFLNDEGRVKVGCHISWPNQLTIWEKAMDKELVYMAPQDFDRLSKGQVEIQSYQSQLFAIGLTMINSGLLVDDSNTTSLYDYKQMRFNFGEYNRRLNQWIVVRGYSDILKALVINLFSLHQQSRILHQELWDMLKIHGEEIKNRQNFVIVNAPGKIHQEVKRYREARAKLNQVYVQNALKGLETSTVVKHQIAHGVVSGNLVGQNVLGIYHIEGQPNMTNNLQTVVSGNLQSSHSHEQQAQVKHVDNKTPQESQ